jgi:SAM-dependent methyltransferase
MSAAISAMTGPQTAVLLLYSATIFIGAGLLFVVQPMVGKMVLPLLGGTPAVWSTCMVFFQGALLLGYAYAHASARWLGVRRQAVLHMLVLALPLAVLPLGVDARFLRGGAVNPVLDVLILLTVAVGLPFVVVSASAPLLQKWFASTGHPAARDPYFLYAASNLGSMLALLGYPFLIEPRLSLRTAEWWSQTRLWTGGYLVLAALTLACAVALWRTKDAGEIAGPSDTAESDDAPPLRERLRWIALAFVPSSLLLGATTYITMDIAAVPLLWVLPLATYLLTFIAAFGRWPARLHRRVTALVAPAVLLMLFAMLSDVFKSIWLSVLCHLLLLLLVALACHGELALRRPTPRHLTGFYLLIALGGVLGGLFNALLSPMIFNSLAEYPLAMVLACVLVLSTGPRAPRAPFLAVALPLGIAALAFILFSNTLALRVDFAFVKSALGVTSKVVSAWFDNLENTVNKELIYGPPIIACFFLRRRPIVLGLALVGVLVAAGYVGARKDDQIRQVRSFFGVLKVVRVEGEQGYTELRHGTTIHGRQSLNSARREEPISYYHRKGPIAQLHGELEGRGPGLHTAVIGLGTGTMAAFARPGDVMTIYEIDARVRDIAFDPRYFTYVADARTRGAAIHLEMGDARLRLEAVRRERPDEKYDLIVVDAFSSDAIPVHLLTREALRLYLDVLKPDGVLALHISNRYLRLEPVVAGLAEDAQLGGRLLIDDPFAGESEGGIESTWAVLARDPAAFGALATDVHWTATPLEPDPRVGVWTDDFHSLLAVFKW